MSKLINNEGATKATFSILENLKEAEDLKIKKRVLAEGYGKTSIIEGEDFEDTSEENKQYSTTYINSFIEDTENLINEWTENLIKTKEQYDNETDEKEKEELQQYMDMVARRLSDLEKDLVKWKNISKSNKNESINSDGFSNDEDTSEDLDECDLKNKDDAPEGSDKPVKKESNEICEKCGKPVEECTCVKEDCEDDKIEERVCEGLEIVNIKGNTVLLKESKGYIVGKNYDKETGLIESAEEYRTEKVANKAFKRLSSRK